MDNYRKAKLEIDSYNGPIVIDGWAADNRHWNGWSYVLMNKKNADLLAEKLVDVIVYDPKRDAFVEVFDENQHESRNDVDKWFGFYSAELDERVYSIGSASWTWTHEILKSEFNNMHN